MLKKPASKNGPVAAQAPTYMDIAKFQKTIGEDMFTSTTSLLKGLVYAEMPMTSVCQPCWQNIKTDTEDLRALLVFMKYEAVPFYHNCPTCKKSKVRLVQYCRKDNNPAKPSYRYQWMCAGYEGKDCLQASVTKNSA